MHKDRLNQAYPLRHGHREGTGLGILAATAAIALLAITLKSVQQRENNAPVSSILSTGNDRRIALFECDHAGIVASAHPNGSNFLRSGPGYQFDKTEEIAPGTSIKLEDVVRVVERNGEVSFWALVPREDRGSLDGIGTGYVGITETGTNGEGLRVNKNLQDACQQITP